MDDKQLLDTAAAIAREAGAILMGHLGRVRIESKGEADLVTAADRASEAHITARLRHQFPRHAMIAEEGTRTEATGDSPRWYVDPLDGTTNFAHGLPLFAVSLGLERGGVMVAGVVYNPPLDEMFTALRGQGAWRNGASIHVASTTRLSGALLATGFPSRKRQHNPNIHFYQHFSLVSHGMRRLGAAALDLCYTACGRFGGFWEFNLQPWDVAAGSLIVTEAGGQVSDMRGHPHHLHSPTILASNGHLHAPLLAAFDDLFAGRVPPLPRPALSPRQPPGAPPSARPRPLPRAGPSGKKLSHPLTGRGSGKRR
ncbi:MAG: inositol monophosphatase family protein [Terriglobales bacterium]